MSEPSLNAGRNIAERKEDLVKRKQVFLKAYEQWGTVRAACHVVKISRSSYNRWHAEDIEFAGELDQVKQAFAESLEELALARVRNPDKNRGSDILLIGLLNANMPSKYRPQFAMSEDSAKELIVEWRKAAREVAREARPTEDGSEAVLPASVAQTLAEILEKRGNAAEKREGQEGDQPEHQDVEA